MDYRQAMNEAKELAYGRCRECGEFLGRQNKSGYCRSCIQLKKLTGKKCKVCGKAIGRNNKSGYCAKRYSRKRDKQREQQRKQYEYHYVSYEKRAKKKTAKMGRCKMPGCGKEFRLERWQHSSLHYCPKCRKSSEYQDYASYEERASRYGF